MDLSYFRWRHVFLFNILRLRFYCENYHHDFFGGLNCGYCLSPTNLNSIGLLTTEIYHRTGITWNTDRHTHTHTHRQRLNLILSPYRIYDRVKREREREREREKDRGRERERERERKRERQTDRHTDRQTERERQRERKKEIKRQTDSSAILHVHTRACARARVCVCVCVYAYMGAVNVYVCAFMHAFNSAILHCDLHLPLMQIGTPVIICDW